MLLSLVKNLFGRAAAKHGNAARAAATNLIRLHIGGRVPHPDWKILDVQPGPHVDYVGHCTDLSALGGESVLEIYASHVLEHLGYRAGLSTALHEFNRVLVPGGTLRASVPDLTTLCTLFLDPALNFDERFEVMRMTFGGQSDNSDFHLVGLNQEFLTSYLQEAGFTGIVRVDSFGIFNDTSSLVFKGRPISLNLTARKPSRA